MLLFVPSQTILEVNKIFVQFHCLSLYPRNDLYRNDFVSKRYIMTFSPRTVAIAVASSQPDLFTVCLFVFPAYKQCLVFLILYESYNVKFSLSNAPVLV